MDQALNVMYLLIIIFYSSIFSSFLCFPFPFYFPPLFTNHPKKKKPFISSTRTSTKQHDYFMRAWKPFEAPSPLPATHLYAR